MVSGQCISRGASRRIDMAQPILYDYMATLCIDDGGGYVQIQAPDYFTARDLMFKSKYGSRWAFMYTYEEFMNLDVNVGPCKDYLWYTSKD